MMPTAQTIWSGAWSEHRLWSGGPWQTVPERRGAAGDQIGVTLRRALGSGVLEKSVRLSRAKPVVRFHYQFDGVDVPVLALEFNLLMRDPSRMTLQWQDGVSRLELRDAGAGLALEIRVNPAASVATVPIETISDSEEGLERTFQGLSLVCLWPLGGRNAWAGDVEWRLTTVTS